MSKKILLIESDSAFAQELSSSIEARGLETRITGDGKEGLELAKVDRPDLIVLCVELPKMSGYAVCNKLKKDDQLKAIPLVITSAEATAETFEAHKKLKARAEDYLIKPFAPELLLQKMGSLIEMPPVIETVDEDLVTLEDVEEIEPIEVGPEQVELAPAQPAAGAEPPVEPGDDDLRLLDEAFENIGRHGQAALDEALSTYAGTGGTAPDGAVEGETPLSDIDQLGAEADAALAALQADEPTEEHFTGTPPALSAAPPQRSTTSRAAPPIAPPALAAVGGESVRALQLEGSVAQQGLELAGVREALHSREAELIELRARAESMASDLQGHAARVRRLEEQTQRASEELARTAEAAKRDEEALRAAHDEIMKSEERLKEAEALAGSEQDRADREEKARLAAEGEARTAGERAREALDSAQGIETRAQAAEARLQAAEARAQAAEARVQAAEARAQAAERDLADLRPKLEEAGQASSLKAAEADQARERAEGLAQEVETLHSRVSAHEGDLAALRPQLDSARQTLAALRQEAEAARAEAESGMGDLKKRTAELEAQNAKHEERVVKAYQKIKGDEKIREKTRKALAIALQLLEDRPTAVVTSDVQPRRE